MKKSLVLLTVATVIVILGFPLLAQAKPQFASNTGNDCSYCHDANHALNKNGLAYLAAGTPDEYGWKNNPAPVAAKSIILKIGDPYMTVNGSKKEVDPGRGTKPLIVKGRTLIPIRTVIETIGGNVAWDAAQQLVTISLNNKTVKLTIGSDKVEIRDQGAQNEDWTSVQLDVPAQVINGRTMVPIRMVTENLGPAIQWDGKTQTVTITY